MTSMDGSPSRTYLAAVAPPQPPPITTTRRRVLGAKSPCSAGAQPPPPPAPHPGAPGAPRRGPELDEPARAVGVLVQQARVLPHALVDLHDLAAHGRGHRPDPLRRLDRRDTLPLRHR